MFGCKVNNMSEAPISSVYTRCQHPSQKLRGILQHTPHTALGSFPFMLQGIQFFFKVQHHLVIGSNIVWHDPANLTPSQFKWVFCVMWHTLCNNPASLKISFTMLARFSPLWLPLTSWKASSNVQRDHSVRDSGMLWTQCTVTPRYRSQANDDQPSNVTDTSPEML